MTALLEMLVWLANETLTMLETIPNLSPPIMTVPPPDTPLASIFVVSNNPTRSPVKIAVPPTSPACWPETSIIPVLRTSPPDPCKIIRPLTCPILLA